LMQDKVCAFDDLPNRSTVSDISLDEGTTPLARSRCQHVSEMRTMTCGTVIQDSNYGASLQ